MACPKCKCKETYPFVEDDVIGLPDDMERCAACGAIFYVEDHIEEEDDEDTLCAQCNGSGEGQYDGTRCMCCKGKGTISRREEE